MKVDVFDHFHLLKISELSTLESNPTIIKLKPADTSVIYHVEIKSFRKDGYKFYSACIFLNGYPVRHSGNKFKLSMVKDFLIDELKRGIKREI